MLDGLHLQCIILASFVPAYGQLELANSVMDFIYFSKCKLEYAKEMDTVTCHGFLLQICIVD